MELSSKTSVSCGAYRMTEIGLLPSDWELRRLREISPSQSVGLVINPSSYFESDGEVPMLVGSCVSAMRIDLSAANCISRESNKRLLASQLAAGDLVVVRVGEPGTTAVIPSMLDGCNCASMMIVRRGAKFDSTWLAYVMNSPVGIAQVESAQYGTAQKQFNVRDAVEFVYPFPPLREQRAIAEALSHADALIESLSLLLAKKRQIKQGAMQDLLTGKKRLPGFSGKWVTRRLDQLADIRSGGTPSTAQEQFWNGDVLWCTPTDITALDSQKYLHDTARKLTELGMRASGAELIPKYSVVMTSRATIGECAINAYPVATNQGFKSFVPFDSVEVEFLYYLLQTQRAGFISLCSGSTFLEIGKAQLLAYEVTVPEQKDEQAAISSALSEIDRSIDVLQAKLGKAKDLKQGMMQVLLTGRIRLVQSGSNVIPLPLKPAAAQSSSLPPHNWQINEAVVIGMLAQRFGSAKMPLGRKRRVKLMYLLHRHAEGRAEGYLKKVAGPYDPNTKYKGPEQIALKNGYVRALRNDIYEDFVAGDKIEQAQRYFEQWYGTAALDWLEQFHYRKTDELELLATVDMAMLDLATSGQPADVAGVKCVIAAHPQWEAKLSRELFSDDQIASAIAECQVLFNS